ncbi:MAG: OadG family protein, partial [Lachnospiraceae bacterium]|nr:OadG family protein [Lachnospiraceae bacterium]
MRRNAKKLLTGVPAILLLTGCDESIVNAGYNTLLGMGMAFAVLIIISLVISLLSVINRAQENKKADDKDMRLKAIDNTISRIEQQENAQAQAAPPAPAAPAAPAAPPA